VKGDFTFLQKIDEELPRDAEEFGSFCGGEGCLPPHESDRLAVTELPGKIPEKAAR
jgi:hypothetical protein